ncbi:hypothetical protein A2U01_0114950, partial [Trifolium medium]|nr:hypothetical protein [Trifolium medium]
MIGLSSMASGCATEEDSPVGVGLTEEDSPVGVGLTEGDLRFAMKLRFGF